VPDKITDEKSIAVLRAASIKISEFGAAQYYNNAPEMTSGKHLTRYVDIYSAGVVLIEMLTGEPNINSSKISEQDKEVIKIVLSGDPKTRLAVYKLPIIHYWRIIVGLKRGQIPDNDQYKSDVKEIFLARRGFEAIIEWYNERKCDQNYKSALNLMLSLAPDKSDTQKIIMHKDTEQKMESFITRNASIDVLLMQCEIISRFLNKVSQGTRANWVGIMKNALQNHIGSAQTSEVKYYISKFNNFSKLY
jgi:serine/threonine protein kinase